MIHLGIWNITSIDGHSSIWAEQAEGVTMWTQELCWNQRPAGQPAIQPTVLSGCSVMPYDMWQMYATIIVCSAPIGGMKKHSWKKICLYYHRLFFLVSVIWKFTPNPLFWWGHAGDCLMHPIPLCQMLGDLFLFIVTLFFLSMLLVWSIARHSSG